MKNDAKLDDEFVTIKEKSLILLLRNLGAAIEDGKSAKIPLIEAAYFASKRKLPFGVDEILERAKKSDPLAREKYFAIDYLRSRGYITRASLDSTEFLRLHRKGFRPGEDRTYYLLKIVKPDWAMDSEKIQDALDLAGKLRKELVLGIVDGKRIRFIKLGRINFE